MATFPLKAFFWFSVTLISGMKLCARQALTAITDRKVLITAVFGHYGAFSDGINSVKNKKKSLFKL